MYQLCRNALRQLGAYTLTKPLIEFLCLTKLLQVFVFY